MVKKMLAARPTEDESSVRSISSDHPTTILFDNGTLAP